jgi:uncharacterized protein (TIGR03435 family)
MRNINISTSGSRLTADAEYAMGLIMYAYHLKMYRISGTEALGALGDTPYDIAAKAEGDGAPTIDEFRQMLQGLLADRFKLKVHRETREMPVYELVVGKNGPKLKESAPDASRLQYLRVNGRNYRVTNSKATMDDVVTAIGNSFLDRPVLDKTGLTGTYDLAITYTPDIRSNRETEPDANDVNIFTAVQERLGLKLVAQKAMVEILVVDHIEKPSEN